MNSDKLLFTPGPLTTSSTIKEAMLRDLGSRDFEFINTVKEIREELLNLGNVSKEKGYEAVIMQGSGTFGIESVISSVIPSDGKFLIIINGAYGERIKKMALIHNIDTVTYVTPENEIPNISEIEDVLKSDSSISHVAIVHCETTTGIMNPIEEVGEICKKHNKTYIVDAMSSFGAVPTEIQPSNIDYLISSSNKCIEGVPGFSFVIANREKLEAINGNARTLSLDLYNQWKGLESNGQFRFTPPTHALLAFRQALKELQEEGGVEGRAKRYSDNYNTLIEKMNEMGFKPYVDEELRGYIITSFLYPDDSNFDFVVFYEKLNERDFVIYPGKLSQVDCFRIGNIGRMDKNDVIALTENIQEVVKEMGIKLN
jgi:2-aminoethylphosphonate-pyruvate transaminase